MVTQPTRLEWQLAILSEDGPPGATVRLTLMGLARHMDRSGATCWPSVARLVEVTALSERAIRAALRTAEEGGWLVREKRGRGYAYEARIPAGGAGIETELVDSPEEKYRQEVPVSGEAIPAGGAGMGEEQHRQEVPVWGKIAAPGAGEYRQEVPVQRTRSEELVRIPSLRSGAVAPLESELTQPADAMLTLTAYAAQQPPEWKSQRPESGAEIVDWWIQLRAEPPPRAVRGKQGAVARRLAERHNRGEILRAMIGIGTIHPHGPPKSEPWDLFDLEKRFLKAYDAFAKHPEIKRWKFRAEFQALSGDNGGST